MEPVIRSVTEELQELGIRDPQVSGSASAVRQAIRDFLLGPKDPQTRAERLAAYNAVDEEFVGKKVRRKLDPKIIGVVQYIKPMMERNFRSRTGDDAKDYKASCFEAYVRWNSTKGSTQRLDQIETLPP